MSRVATAARCGDATTGTDGTWYAPPLPQTIAAAEARWPQYRRRADWLVARFPTVQTFGVAGCGFGFTLYELFTVYGKTPYGCDIAWATNVAAQILTAWSTHIVTADVTITTQMTAFRRAGNTGSNKYAVVFTEDLLPCANDDAEVATMLTNLRAVGTQLVHLITPPPYAVSDLLPHTMAEWRALIGPNDVIVDPSLTEQP